MKLKLRKAPVKVILVLICVIALLIVIVSLLLSWEQRHYYFETDDQDYTQYDEDSGLDEVYYNGAWYAQKPDIETILCIGIDKNEGDDTVADLGNYNSQQCDFLVAVVLDNRNKSYTALQINRDTVAEIPVIGFGGDVLSTETGQIALAHTYGSGGKDSCENTVEAVSNLLTGVKIDHYISVTMEAVPIINDAVGGVTLTVAEDYPNDGFVKGETVTLLGDKALAYVRGRMTVGDGSNLGRMERQRQYMTALKDVYTQKLAEDPTLALSAITSISEYMISDCSVYDLSDLVNATNEYTFEGFKTLEGEAIQGEKFMEFYADKEALEQLVFDIYYEKKDEE